MDASIELKIVSKHLLEMSKLHTPQERVFIAKQLFSFIAEFNVVEHCKEIYPDFEHCVRTKLQELAGDDNWGDELSAYYWGKIFGTAFH